MLNEIKFRTPEYLQHGTPRQQAAYTALMSLQIFSLLRAFTPVLTGTIPLDIDIETSDLDIVCFTENLSAFADQLTLLFGDQANFRSHQKMIRGKVCIIARFAYAGFWVEIFGQNQPVEWQYAYRHLLIEAHLLESTPAAREAIRQLKQRGLKTEPAFAAYFDLDGDPYEVLYAMSFSGGDIFDSE